MCLLQAPRTVEAVVPAETSRIVCEYLQELKSKMDPPCATSALPLWRSYHSTCFQCLSQPRTSCSFFSSRCVNVCSQPGLRMSFGFSVGDLVSAIGIEVRNANVIRQSQLERKCQQLDQELHQSALPLVGLWEACKPTDLE
jgi:hypothetical protein